jgi:hypothetical protein
VIRGASLGARFSLPPVDGFASSCGAGAAGDASVFFRRRPRRHVGHRRLLAGGRADFFRRRGLEDADDNRCDGGRRCERPPATTRRHRFLCVDGLRTRAGFAVRRGEDRGVDGRRRLFARQRAPCAIDVRADE